MDNDGIGVELPKQQTSAVSIILKLVAALVVLGAIAFGVLFIFNSSAAVEVTSEDLVTETEGGITFKRPMQWQKIDPQDVGINYAYTENGNSLGNSNHAMLISRDDLGLNYDELTDAQKTILEESFETQFSSTESLQNGSCTEVGSISNEKREQAGYDFALIVEATCNKFENRAVEATLKLLIGIDNEKFDIVGVSAINETWEKSGAALDEILASVMPAN